jgi:signal transduction histidine kinase
MPPASFASPPFDVRIVPVRNPAPTGRHPGGPYNLLGVKTFALFEDRSKIRNLENQLVRAEKLITVGVLSAGIAHEIGSPLAVIRGRAEQVLRQVVSGPRAEDLRVIIKHIDHISSTIRQLLDFSRRQPTLRRAVALESVVRRARDLLQWKLEPRRLHLETELDPDLPPLAADPDQLQQVLVNLLLNACDASEPGGVIRLCARRGAEGLVTLEIIDQGCGIALEHLHAVFDPFFTTKKGGEGTGLGLPIVASIVRNHAGEINLVSAQGKGTTVTVTWPALADRQAAHA